MPSLSRVASVKHHDAADDGDDRGIEHRAHAHELVERLLAFDAARLMLMSVS